MTVLNLTTVPPRRKLTIVPTVTTCETCSRQLVRGRGGPAPRWCPECRADRNRAAAAARRRASSATRISRVAGTRNNRHDWQLPAEDHLAMRAARLRLCVNEAAAILRQVIPANGGAIPMAPALAVAAARALQVLDSVPVGR